MSKFICINTVVEDIFTVGKTYEGLEVDDSEFKITGNEGQEAFIFEGSDGTFGLLVTMCEAVAIFEKVEEA